MKHFISLLIFVSGFQYLNAQNGKQKVLVFDIKEEIAPSATRITEKAIKQAVDLKANLILIHMNTYGGLVSDANTIKTAIQNSKIPVYVFIDNNAASAGALISIACDKIYMRKGASIGAATVVTEQGAAAPDKYQSYMRSIMRSTAEAHGKDTIITGNDTIFKFKRDPNIAEAMVDPRKVVPGITDSGQVITFTTEEAIKYGYCEGEASSLEEILEKNGITNFEIVKIEKSGIDKIIGFLTYPAVSSVLILIILAGIYYELQAPGIGFPLLVAIIAGLLYVTPLYLDGLAANWEILVILGGLVLVGLEVFVIPGFGVAGISGFALILIGLVLSMVRNVNFDFTLTSSGELTNALSAVAVAMVIFVVLIIYTGRGLVHSSLFKRIVLQNTLSGSKLEFEQITIDLTGTMATTHTDLRPLGKIKSGGELFEAKTMGQFISKGVAVDVLFQEGIYWVVKEKK
jgi:membrane-bound serine protease (ClpP class)